MNRQYLSQVDPALAGSFGATEGKLIELTTPYLLAAIDLMDAVATMLIQTCWRKWEGVDDSVDSDLISATYKALDEERYQYVIDLSHFAETVAFANDRDRRAVIINHAIAIRETKGGVCVNDVLSSVDWSATSLEFTLALHALRGEADLFLEALPKALSAEAITVRSMREWPLFRPWRAKEWFGKAVEQAEQSSLRRSCIEKGNALESPMKQLPAASMAAPCIPEAGADTARHTKNESKAQSELGSSEVPR